MPYQIKKVGPHWKLWNIKKKEFVNKNYKSKASAAASGINFGRYRKEKLVLRGSKLVKVKK